MASLAGSGGLPDILGDQNNSNIQSEASNEHPERSFYNPITKDTVEFPQLIDVIKEYKKNPSEWPDHRNFSRERLCIIEKYEISDKKRFIESCKIAEEWRNTNRMIPKIYPSEAQWQYDIESLEELLDHALTLDTIRGMEGESLKQDILLTKIEIRLS